jgi:hypothetical protein
MVYLLFKSQFQAASFVFYQQLMFGPMSAYWSLVFHIISSLGKPHSESYTFKENDAGGFKFFSFIFISSSELFYPVESPVSC